MVTQISQTNRAVIHKQHTEGSGGSHHQIPHYPVCLCSQTYGNVYTETAEVELLHLENRLVRITTAISLHFDKLYAHRSQTLMALYPSKYVKLAQTTKDGPYKAMGNIRIRMKLLWHLFGKYQVVFSVCLKERYLTSGEFTKMYSGV